MEFIYVTVMEGFDMADKLMNTTLNWATFPATALSTAFTISSSVSICTPLMAGTWSSRPTQKKNLSEGKMQNDKNEVKSFKSICWNH